MSHALGDRLARGDLLLLDGAIGTRLQAMGLAAGEAPEAWNLSRPADVAAVARAYADAGSDIVTTNSFGGSPLKLAAHGLEGQAVDLNRAAVRAARIGADGRALVSGSIGPCGGLLEPYGDLAVADVAAGFALQAEALAAGGVDLISVETMIDLREAVLAVQAARAALPDGVITATLTFEPSPGVGSPSWATTCPPPRPNCWPRAPMSWAVTADRAPPAWWRSPAPSPKPPTRP